MKQRSTVRRMTAAMVLAAPTPRPWWNTNFTWTAEDIAKLEVLAEAGADLHRSSAALGRSPTAICWKGRDLGVAMPLEWMQLIRRKR